MSQPQADPARQVQIYNPIFGCDPEGFFQDKEGRIVGSERVIPEVGLNANNDPSGYGRIVRDGVQFELNPSGGSCREGMGQRIAESFRTLHRHLATLKDRPLTISFRGVVEVDETEFAALSERSRILGCQPSFNVYEGSSSLGVEDQSTFRTRSAGGHIHLGNLPYVRKSADKSSLIPVMDVLVGNTCVLLDRNPLNAERRKVYGRAGEYRLPSHGIEYRTLSNFWLQDYKLMSFVMGLSRLAMSVWATVKGPYGGWDAADTLLEGVDLPSIARAINENNVPLAKENYLRVREFIARHVDRNAQTGLNSYNLSSFDYFVQKVDEGGLGYWFNGDPVQKWMRQGFVGQGWEMFLQGLPQASKGVEPQIAKAS